MNTAVPKVRMGFVGGGAGAFIAQAHRQAAGLDGRFELVCGAFSRDPANNQATAAVLGVALRGATTNGSKCFRPNRLCLPSSAWSCW